MTLAVAMNPYASNVPDSLIAAAGRLGIAVRTVDLPSLRVGIAPLGEVTVADEAGPVAATSLAPFLLFGFPAAVTALRVLAGTARAQNPVDSVLLADDKAAAADIGYPVVVKRAHGAQGRWVRRAADPATLATALAELAAEGPGALIVQPEVTECAGVTVRAVLTGGDLIAVTERRAAPPEWRSNIAGGATQRRTELTG